MNMGRRGLLKLMGVAPAAAPAVAAALSAGAAGVGVVGLGAASAGYNQLPGAINPSGGARFVEFAQWMLGGGERQMRDQAREVRGLDPDIALMSVPLNTKVIWQRDRNYQRILTEQKSWFDRRISTQGFVEEWF